MARVLIGCSPTDALAEVRASLEDAGHEVQATESADAVLRAARGATVDLVIVVQALKGGTGAEVCEVLDGVSGRAKMLYVGDEEPAGADARVAPGESFAVLEQALALLERSSSRAREREREATADAGREVDWSVDDPSSAGSSPPPPPEPQRPPARPPAKPNGSPRGRASQERFQSLQRRAREADYYEVLGVTAAATDLEVRAAHEAAIASLEELAAESPIPRAHLEEVQSVLDEALDVLGDPALRAAYTRNRP